VQGFNTLVKRFPTNMFAAAFNFSEAPYYDIPDEAREVPDVDFSDIRSDKEGE
jgi:hypothetical protein